MSDDGNWFAPRRYGCGAGLPISWQGWVATLVFIAIATADGWLFGREPVKMIAVLVPSTVAFLVIAAQKTRGGWRWRWGDKD